MPQILDYQSPEWKRLFANLLDDIEEQQCVLLLGPEIVQLDGRPLHVCLREYLQADFPEEISYYYERDGLYLFADHLAKSDVQRGVRRFFKRLGLENGLNESIFRQIAQIPFHLVLSISPDNFLSDVCYKYGVRHRSAFFHPGGKAVDEVEAPTKESPLFYNLFGRFTRDNSLVLDYDDLFHLLQSSLGAPGLPDKLRAALQRAKTFVFLGFDFDKWYSQLLLRLLSGEKGIRKYALNTQIADAQTHTFLVKQFEVAFLGDDKAFFQRLYRECEKEGLLRELTEPHSLLARRVIRLVQEAELEAAIDALREARMEDGDRLVAGLSAQYISLKEDKDKGIIDSRDVTVRFNRLVDSILNLTRMLP